MGGGEISQTESLGVGQRQNSPLPPDAEQIEAMGGEKFVYFLFTHLFAAFEFDRNLVAKDEIRMTQGRRLHFI